MAAFHSVLLLLLHDVWGFSMNWAGHTSLGAPLRTAVYNPLSATGEGRLEQIVSEINADVLLLAGTQFKHPCTTSEPYKTFWIDKYFVFSWGWRAGASNRSAGVAIVLGPRLASNTILQVCSPGEGLQGRAGA